MVQLSDDVVICVGVTLSSTGIVTPVNVSGTNPVSNLSWTLGASIVRDFTNKFAQFGLAGLDAERFAMAYAKSNDSGNLVVVGSYVASGPSLTTGTKFSTGLSTGTSPTFRRVELVGITASQAVMMVDSNAYLLDVSGTTVSSMSSAVAISGYSNLRWPWMSRLSDSIFLLTALDDDGSTPRLMSMLGQVNAGVLTFGTPTVIETANITDFATSTLTPNRAMLSYVDTSDLGVTRVLAVSGGSVAAGAAVTMSGSDTVQWMTATGLTNSLGAALYSKTSDADVYVWAGTALPVALSAFECD